MAKTVTDFIKQAKKKKLSSEIRLYLIDKNTHYFVNEGKVKSGFASKINITKNRDNVLSTFSKMGFLFDEIIRMHIIGYSNEKNSSELLYVLNLVPLNRKIRTFLDWEVFPPEFTRDMSRLFEVRNNLVHAVNINEVNYNPNKILPLSSKTGFNKFKTDFEKAWKSLLQIYQVQQKDSLKNLGRDLGIIY